jgi:hypothetical protein
MYIKEAKKLVKELNFISPEDIKPCTEQDIMDLEKNLGFKLPEAYKEFLLWAGHKLGKMFKEDLIYYNDVIQNNKALKFEIPNEGFVLPEDIFIIATDYSWLYIIFSFLKDGDNPPIYIYDTNGDTIKKIYESFSDYIVGIIKFWYKNYYKPI